jgi:hypothetical protein
MADRCNYDANCGKCGFYFEIEIVNDKGDTINNDEGTCRARPPVVTETNQRFPVVQEWESACGAFRRTNVSGAGQQ